MNHVLNDRGETVEAVGAPGTVERAQCERPEFIKELAAFRTDPGDNANPSEHPVKDGAEVIVFAAQSLHERGIVSHEEAVAILTAAGFEKESSAPILRQLQIINQDHDRMLRGAILPTPAPPSQLAPEISE